MHRLSPVRRALAIRGLAFAGLASTALSPAAAQSVTVQTVANLGLTTADPLAYDPANATFYGTSGNTLFSYSPAGGLQNVYTLTSADGSFQPRTGYLAYDPATQSLYGTTSMGLFSYSPSAGFHDLTTLPSPNGPLLDVGGTLYGTTNAGGTGYYLGVPIQQGLLYSYTPGANSDTQLAAIANLGYVNPLAQDFTNGLAYDAATGTFYGGVNSSVLTVYPTPPPPGGISNGGLFSYSSQGGLGDAHEFSGPDGSEPTPGLVDVGGVLYGVTLQGGANGVGTLFSYTPGTGLRTLHDFAYTGDGGIVQGQTPLVYDPATGLILGTTPGARTGLPTDSLGKLYSYSPSGGYENLYDFTALGGAPAGLTDVGGTLYGVTGNGTLVAIQPHAAVPESSPLALLALGLLPVALRAHRRRRAA